MSTEFLLGSDKNFLKLDHGDDFTVLLIYFKKQIVRLNRLLVCFMNYLNKTVFKKEIGGKELEYFKQIEELV